MLKIPPLYQWHTLSDLGAEEMVRDRLSFRRFYGLPLSSSKPKDLESAFTLAVLSIAFP